MRRWADALLCGVMLVGVGRTPASAADSVGRQIARFTTASLSAYAAPGSSSVVAVEPFAQHGLDAAGSSAWTDQAFQLEDALLKAPGVTLQKPLASSSAFVVSGDVYPAPDGLAVHVRLQTAADRFVLAAASFTANLPGVALRADDGEPKPILPLLFKRWGQAAPRGPWSVSAAAGLHRDRFDSWLAGADVRRHDHPWVGSFRFGEFTRTKEDSYTTTNAGPSYRRLSVDVLTLEATLSRTLLRTGFYAPGIGRVPLRHSFFAGAGGKLDLIDSTEVDARKFPTVVLTTVSEFRTSRLSPLVLAGVVLHPTPALDISVYGAWRPIRPLFEGLQQQAVTARFELGLRLL